MLMDLFLKTLPGITLHTTISHNPTANTAHPSISSSSSGVIRAQRLHFHAFMLAVHQQLHALQQVCFVTRWLQ
jgi:predicted ATPase